MIREFEAELDISINGEGGGKAMVKFKLEIVFDDTGIDKMTYTIPQQKIQVGRWVYDEDEDEEYQVDSIIELREMNKPFMYVTYTSVQKPWQLWLHAFKKTRVDDKDLFRTDNYELYMK